ncbi:hypothetical protein ACRE_006930 [Hapsidospora chrysogenum ATCC 11550]|uniref:Uncharacterized protein n=1 Tax=Hapsidospora chrysogenum (strain ATCC 11550 / CBS 779.69 / DSM 880 / IAM 14645 / JCM 23072 / IMI 49137) TaxID=857340 RepID=A0A086TGR8_HAPC1|nr:hypothetical protein ACRE_006930 [Hapsidospora chrysogenum ATCC 11550]
MKAAIFLSFAATVMASVLNKRQCHADNCARQVTGTRPGLSPIESRRADCSSFMTSTVVPDTVTTTTTVIITLRGTAGEAPEPTEYPTATVPAYASSCDDGVEYSSVCSCWGITAAVTTAPTPTEIQTVTTTWEYCDDL